MQQSIGSFIDEKKRTAAEMLDLYLEEDKGTINVCFSLVAFISLESPTEQKGAGTSLSFMKWYYDFLKGTHCYTAGSLSGLLAKEVRKSLLFSV